MSLLDNASLVLTPNAYKEGKLYSVIPSNGNGDFTATRATTATRVNADGLVDLVPYNLVTYSEQFSDASWAKLDSTITANNTTAPDGTLTADKLNNNASGFCRLTSPTFVFSAGVNYNFSFWYKNVDASYLSLVSLSNNTGIQIDLNTNTFFANSGTWSAANVESFDNGWYRVDAVVNFPSGASSQIYFRISTSASITSIDYSKSVFLWGAQLVEGTSARDYLRTETRLNIPRVDYSLGGCPNILLEPQRTNLALQSSSFDNAVWDKNNTTVAANSTISPSGIQDADTIQRDGVLSSLTLAQDISVTSGVTYTLSVYAKKNTNNFIQITGRSTSFALTSFANFDLNNGVVGTVGATATATITNVGNGWYRCTATMAATATASIDSMMIHMVTSASAVRLEPNTLNTSVFLWGAQLEAGAYATSYIPTTTASVTRNADSITRNNIFTNGLITAAGGTWFVELRNNRAYPDGLFTNFLRIANNSNFFSSTAALSITQWSTANERVSITKRVGSTNTQLFVTTTDTIKVALKWNGTTADVFVNGVKVVASTSFTTTNMDFLVGGGDRSTIFINEMALFPTPLTDAQCIALTQ